MARTGTSPRAQGTAPKRKARSSAEVPRTTTNAAERPGVLSLDQSAASRRVRPRVEPAAGTESTLGDPHLLERRPVVRRPLAPQQVAAVGAHERPVHLQAAPVGRTRVVPGALV